jgi:sugar O-acyltransferase (sialic acid O-acetyltransferase NeuD family)
MENPVIIIGAGSLGIQALDIFESNGVVVYGFLDDNKELHGTAIGDVSVLGSTDDAGFTKLIGHKCEAFIAVGERVVREQLVEMLNERRKTMPVNAIHFKASVSKMALIGHGNFVGANAVIDAQASVGNHCTVESGSVLQTRVKVGNFVTVGAGAVIGNNVTVEDNVFIGTGVRIIAGVTIGKNARIGAGSVVMQDVAAGKTVFGNPAVEIKR